MCIYHQDSQLQDFENLIVDLYSRGVDAAITYLLDQGSATRDITKQSYYADRVVEVLSHGFQVSPLSIVVIKEQAPIKTDDLKELRDQILSYAVGVSFGRFDFGHVTGEYEFPQQPSPWISCQSLAPVCYAIGQKPFISTMGSWWMMLDTSMICLSLSSQCLKDLRLPYQRT